MSNYDTKSVDGLMTMFYNGAANRNQVTTFDYVANPHFDLQFALSAKQFAWLCDVECREMDGRVASRAGRGREVTGEIEGVGSFRAMEQRNGSALVNIKRTK